MSDDLSNTFQQRRALEQALAALADTTNEAELVEAVRALKFAYTPALLLPALLKRLDTPNSQLRGGLARLAALLPPEESAPALRRYAGDRRNSAQGRTTAAMILDRFLGEPAPPALTADLQSSDDAAFQSLVEAVTEARANPHVLLEYVTQMQPYGEEIALLVLRHLDRLPAADRVGLQRLLALDARPVVARAALHALEALATAGDAPAARALYTLQWAPAAELAAQAARAQRKLQFRGAGFAPPPPTNNRALLAPAELSGAQWLLLEIPTEPGAPDAAAPLVAGFHLHLDYGLLDCFFGAPTTLAPLPPPAAPGTLHSLPAAAPAAVLLEAPFDLARFVLLRALEPYAQGRAPNPLRAEYLLHHDRIWCCTPPAPQPAAAALLDATALSDAAALEPLPDADAAALCSLLMAEPCMADWVIPARPLLGRALDAAGSAGRGSLERLTHEALAAIDAGPARTTVRRNLRNALRLQAVWLHAAGRSALAEPTARLARTVEQWPLADNPLLFAALRRGLDQAHPA